MSGSRSTAPKPVPISNEVLVQDISAHIKAALRGFHEHSKECKTCRNPIRVYQERRNLCPEGQVQSKKIMELLYRKAAYVEKGTFTVEYKQGWEAVDGLIRMICHFRQGEYTNKVIDLDRAVPKESLQHKHIPYVLANSESDKDGVSGRGSAYKEDMARKEGRQYTYSRPARSHSTRRDGNRRYPDPEPTYNYGDPRTSYINASTGVPQAGFPQTGRDSEKTPSSPTSSGRSVHFNPNLEIREYETERRR